MIALDTQIWRWMVSDDKQLTQRHRQIIQTERIDGLAVSAISLWEIAKAVEVKRLTLAIPVLDWLKKAEAYPDVKIIPLTGDIVVASTTLPKPIHGDPGDQLVIATANVLGVKLLTADAKILVYPHVQCLR